MPYFAQAWTMYSAAPPGIPGQSPISGSSTVDHSRHRAPDPSAMSLPARPRSGDHPRKVGST
ncbi:hypothetical protein AB0A71_38340 [Kitasatospora aureofaciens]|uniref:hypothetical protein n=1 Tax=Kitasatospora aureofaciens TaxID=1894 RepID=UPI0034043D8D